MTRIVIHNHLTRDAVKQPAWRPHKGRGKPLAFDISSTNDCSAECACDNCKDHRVYDRFVARDVLPLKQAEAEFAAVERERDEMKEKVRAALKTGMPLSNISNRFGARQKEIERRYKAASNALVASRDVHGWPVERGP
jgi:hypothetical protein